MSSVKELLEMLRERTPMYIGGRSIFQLQAFIDGWLFDREVLDEDLLDQFYQWLVKRFNITSSQSWAKIILFYSTDEVSALENFFKYFDDFIEQTEIVTKDQEPFSR